MANLKINQRVVFIGHKTQDSETIAPKPNTIVTIKDYGAYPHYFILKEFEFAQNNRRQSFHERTLRPLQYENISNEIVSQLKTIDERCDVEIKQIETIETIKQ